MQNNSIETIIKDYQLAYESRIMSLFARKEVFMGKAKFGIFGDGKEIAQIAMAKVFQKGDFRAGYYRDQTFMLAIDQLSIEQYFAQLYAHADVLAEPASAGRMMNSHFATRMLNKEGHFYNLQQQKNVSADISPTAAQMPRLLGLAYASKLYRENIDLHKYTNFSNKGNEIAFGTIGNASTAEGMFFEAINAAGVLQVPMLVSVWDDDYGISVPQEYHTTKQSISAALAGFQAKGQEKGIKIFTVKGWDYPNLCTTYVQAAEICRKEHIPVLVHVQELTQPQGHSTSGSHERYKSKKRLSWEKKYDCLIQMREWILNNNWITAQKLENIEQKATAKVKEAKTKAWQQFRKWIDEDLKTTIQQLQSLQQNSAQSEEINTILQQLTTTTHPTQKHIAQAIRKTLYAIKDENTKTKDELIIWYNKIKNKNKQRYQTHLYSQSSDAAIHIKSIEPVTDHNQPTVNGYQILQTCFDAILEQDSRVFIIGEDVGKIGDVNQGLAGIQEKYGNLRLTDTGIRECTIIGQGIGAAMRGLKPIVEIQYLDYMLYAIQILSDDLATLQYRTHGGQKAPLVIRTRGHRLEGIWHSGSYLAGIIHNLRGIYVLVPRNMVQAAGFYNTMLLSDDSALIIECLSGYRLKEKMPKNISTFRVPLGIPEILRIGKDITIVTYGAMCKIVMKAATYLHTKFNIDCEVIDVQTLLPFDLNKKIVQSLKKTNKIIFADEDVPGGTTAYMMQQVIENQQGYYHLDASPMTITSQAHRPAYGDDGDYYAKPQEEDIIEAAYQMMYEYNPKKYSKLF